MAHEVTLSNGRTILLIENYEGLTIASADDLGGPDAFILHMDRNGVLVYPNSGCATWDLCEGLAEIAKE